MLHAMVHEVTQIQRVGEIIEIGQLVRHMEFARLSAWNTI